MELNIREAETLALEVWRAGAACICPHTNTRFYQGTAPDDVWLDGDISILLRCDAVLCTPRWHSSEGAKREVAVAVAKGIPVFFSLGRLVEWIKRQEVRG